MMDTENDLEHLLERHRSGDAAAGRALLDRAHHRLVRIVQAVLNRDFPRLHEGHDAESIVDETWISLVRALQTTRPATTSEFFGLIFLKVRQTLLAVARREKRLARGRGEPPADGEDPGAVGVCDTPVTTHEPGRLAILTELHGQIASLPSPERLVFELCYYQGLTQAEAAAEMGLHPKAVSRLWLRATTRLANWLDDADGLR